MDEMRDAGVTFCNRNVTRLRGALIFAAIALAVCLVIGLGVHKSKGMGKKAPPVVNSLPIEGKFADSLLLAPCGTKNLLIVGETSPNSQY